MWDSEKVADRYQGATSGRELLAFETGRARALLVAGSPIVGTLRGWARVAVAGYVAGGLAAGP